MPLDRAAFAAHVAAGYNQVPLVVATDRGALGPVDLLRALPEEHRFLLESTRVSEEGRYSILGAEPFATFRAKGPRYWIGGRAFEGDPIAALKSVMQQWRGLRLPGMPLFSGGAVGFFGYGASRYFQGLPPHPHDDLGVADIAFHFVDAFFAFDHGADRILAIATGDDYDACQRRVDSLLEVIERARRRSRSAGALAAPGSPAVRAGEAWRPSAAYTSNFTKEEYLGAVARIQSYIRTGDTYQVNLSQRLEAEYGGGGLDLYETLSRIDPVHFASYFAWGDLEIVSASPERLVRVEGGRAFTRPIAGTRRRGGDEENARFLHELRTCEKELSEHVMLVDLARNDLGRVCRFGSVHVSKLMEIANYAHVMHIESEVVGDVAPEMGLIDVTASLFPGGTITGVPKIRTMEIIAELEPHARGLYTGSIGYLSFAGEMDLNIAIRTIVLKDRRAYVQVGGGVVIDSDPEREFKETLNKARSLLLALGQAGAQAQAAAGAPAKPAARSAWPAPSPEAPQRSTPPR
ncbi:anthranilate synthase component I family protein [Pendulispora albinea]|uniref:Anthranilate synthase component I family protein n=1 Tax=Pendulispora albinea TaxID=2741071 RepID=A0ABZ2LZI9_9BACT